MEAFKSAGIWWNADSPERQVVGTLEYSDESGFILETPLNTLQELEATVIGLNQTQIIPLIHGELRNGKSVTLVEPIKTNFTIGGQGTYEQYMCLLGYVGDTVCSADPMIEQVELYLSHLRDWVVRDFSSLRLPEKNGLYGLVIDYKYEAPEDSLLAESTDWSVWLSHRTSIQLPSPKGFSFAQDCRLLVDLKNPLSLKEVDECLIAPLERFQSFCLDRGNRILEIKVRLHKEQNWHDISTYHHEKSTTDKLDKIVQPYDMLISLSQLEDKLSSVLLKWLQLSGMRKEPFRFWLLSTKSDNHR